MLPRRTFSDGPPPWPPCSDWTPRDCFTPRPSPAAASPKPESGSRAVTCWPPNHEHSPRRGLAPNAKRGSALDAVVEGTAVESDPTGTSVGLGGATGPEWPGHPRRLRDERRRRCRGVCFLEDIEHPVRVARAVMEDTPHVLLAGDGARDFALAKGFEARNLLTEDSRKAWEDWRKSAEYKPVINVENHDTIGMIAQDLDGRLAGACTTSGLAYKLRGRVDSPIIGAGLFVDDAVGARTATGLGEAVMKTLGSFLVVELMRQGASPAEACLEAVERISRKMPVDDLQVGYLAMDTQGNAGAHAIHGGFNYARSVGDQTELIDSLPALTMSGKDPTLLSSKRGNLAGLWTLARPANLLYASATLLLLRFGWMACWAPEGRLEPPARPVPRGPVGRGFAHGGRQDQRLLRRGGDLHQLTGPGHRGPHRETTRADLGPSGDPLHRPLPRPAFVGSTGPLGAPDSRGRRGLRPLDVQCPLEIHSAGWQWHGGSPHRIGPRLAGAPEAPFHATSEAELRTLWWSLGAYGSLAAGVAMAREIAKDAQDIAGDTAAGKNTFPVRFGASKARILCASLLSPRRGLRGHTVVLGTCRPPHRSPDLVGTLSRLVVGLCGSSAALSALGPRVQGHPAYAAAWQPAVPVDWPL